MKITKSQLNAIIREAVSAELQEMRKAATAKKVVTEEQLEEDFGNFVRSITGKDEQFFTVLSDLLASPAQALAHEDFLNKNKKMLLNKASYSDGGPLHTAALYAVQAANKAAGVKGYGQGKTIDDVFAAVVNAVKMLG